MDSHTIVVASSAQDAAAGVIRIPEDLAGLQLRPGDRVVFAAGWDSSLLPGLRQACARLPLLDTTTTAHMLNVTTATVSMWKRRGRAYPAGLIPADRGIRGAEHAPLYRIADLLELAAAAQTRSQRRTRTRHTGEPAGVLSAPSC